MFTRLALITIAALVLLWTGSAFAATTVTVTRTDDPPPGSGNLCGPPSLNCSLRHAIAAVQGGSNTVVLPAGDYTLTQGQLLVTGTVFVQGAGARRTTIEQLTPSSRVIEVLNAGTSFGLTGVTLTGGSADDSSPQPAQGGGIYTSGAGLTLTDDAIVGNRVFSNQGLEAAAGGGLFIGGVLTMRRTTVAGNRAAGGALAVGGIADFGGTVYADDSTISGNAAIVFESPPPSAMIAVGGIQIGFFASGLLSTASVTIADNRASGATGTNPLNAGNVFVAAAGSEFHSVDTIIARGTGEAGHENCAADAGVVIDSRGYNLQDRAQQCGLAKTGDLVGVNPALGALANNGGATDTRALGAGSAAIDRGHPGACPDSGSSTLVIDQRGTPRVQGGRCDIGAFESTPPPPPHLSGLKLKPSTFRRGKGTTVSYADSEKATTTLTVLRRTRGVRKGGKCVVAKKGSTGKRCTLFKAVGSFKHADVAGPNSFHWKAKLKGKALARATYRLRAVARNAQGRTSAPATAGFKVVG